MKKKNYVFAYSIILLFITCNYSCKRDRYNVLTPKKVTGALKADRTDNKSGDMLLIDFKDSISSENIKVESSVEDSILKSVLSYKKGNSWVTINCFEINLKNDKYRRGMTLSVKEKAETLKDNFDVSELAKMSDMLDAIPELLFNKLGRKDFYKESSQAMFYHMAAINSARRALVNKSEDCECSINITYITDRTPFTCLEDKYIGATDALKIVLTIVNGKKIYGKNIKAEKTLTYLRENFGKPVPLSKATELINAEIRYFWENELSKFERNTLVTGHKIKSKPPTSKDTTEATASDEACAYEVDELPTAANCLVLGIIWGTQCGCCGNYNGPCLCCNALCMAHDIFCENCGWGCGPDCVNGC